MAIRLGVIGVNHWHALYDAAYLIELQRLDDVEVVALQDADLDIARHRATSAGGAAIFTDIGSMLSESRPDFVLALGRHNEMASAAHLLLDLRLPFLMEKPMGVSAGEVSTIAERVRKTGGFAAVPLPFRYQPFVSLARTWLTSGRFGPLSHLTFRQMRPTSDRYPAWGAPWMLDPEIAGGGCLRNIGIHGLDLFAHITGEDVEVVGAQTSNRGLGKAVEDYACVMLRTRTGVVGTVEVGNMYPASGGQSMFQISGRDSQLSVVDGAAIVVSADGTETIDVRPREKPFFQVLRATLDAWKRGDPPPTDVHDCLRAVRLVDRAYEFSRGLAGGNGAGTTDS